jgi:DNA mismatch repair ATPase MutL
VRAVSRTPSPTPSSEGEPAEKKSRITRETVSETHPRKKSDSKEAKEKSTHSSSSKPSEKSSSSSRHRSEKSSNSSRHRSSSSSRKHNSGSDTDDEDVVPELKTIRGKAFDEFLGHLKLACQTTSVTFKRAYSLPKGRYQLLKLYVAKKSKYGTILGLLKNKSTSEVSLASMPGSFTHIPKKYYGLYEKLEVHIEKSEGRNAAKIKLLTS